MTGDIIDKIKIEVEKSGHPVSLKVSQILDKHNWFVKNAPRFALPKDTTFSEIDVVGVKESKFIGDTLDYLIIECKKQDKPWIFFKQNKKNSDVLTINCNRMNEQGSGIYDWIETNGYFESHYYYGRELCTYFFVGLTNPDQNPAKTLDRAIYQVIRALLFYISQQEQNIKVKLFYPIIVFDGDIYEASYKNDELIINESNHINLYFEAEFDKLEKILTSDGKYVKWIDSKPFVIDIVKLEYFDEFLKKFEI
jgi:hypothetical protein